MCLTFHINSVHAAMHQCSYSFLKPRSKLQFSSEALMNIQRPPRIPLIPFQPVDFIVYLWMTNKERFPLTSWANRATLLWTAPNHLPTTWKRATIHWRQIDFYIIPPLPCHLISKRFPVQSISFIVILMVIFISEKEPLLLFPRQYKECILLLPMFFGCYMCMSFSDQSFNEENKFILSTSIPLPS